MGFQRAEPRRNASGCHQTHERQVHCTIPGCGKKRKGDKFYAVGEYWNGDLNTLDAYIKSVGHKVNLFDVPLHYNLFQASQEGKNYDLQNILKTH